MGLAMDWINNLLYYSYYDAPNSYIRVTNFPSIDYHYTVFTSQKDKPSLIAVNPQLKYLYWIDQVSLNKRKTLFKSILLKLNLLFKGQYPKLERAFLDGKNRTVLINTNIVSPTDIFVDQTNGDIYWSDNTRDTIERCSWNGSNRVVVRSKKLPNTRAVYVQDDVLYYTDSRLRGVYSTLLLNISNTTNIPDQLLVKQVQSYSLGELILFDEKSQPRNFASACAVSGRRSLCEQICFALPDGLVKTSTCACSIGVLDVNGRTCNRPKEYLIFAMENEIRSVNLPQNNNIPGKIWCNSKNSGVKLKIQ